MDASEKSELKREIELYLAERYKEVLMPRYSVSTEPRGESVPTEIKTPAVRAVQEYVREQADEETFSEQLLRTIRERGLRESDVYNSVFLDRTLFSKLRSDPNYRPSKRTAILLILALHLPLTEANKLLGKAGYRLSHSDRGDLIVEYFISQGKFDVLEINEMLAEFNEPLLLKDR